MRSSISEIRGLGVALFAIFVTSSMAGCLMNTVDDVAIFEDLAMKGEMGIVLDGGPPPDTAKRLDASHAPADLAGCTGKETFLAAKSAMLSSCGGFGPMSCHTRAPFGGSLDLTDAHSYASLVNVAASGSPGKLRVQPGDADHSFLVEKLTNMLTPTEGNPMPQGEGIRWTAPDPAKLQVLRCWIGLGALNN